MLTPRNIETLLGLLRRLEKSNLIKWNKSHSKLYLKLEQELSKLRHQKYLEGKSLRNGKPILDIH